MLEFGGGSLEVLGDLAAADGGGSDQLETLAVQNLLAVCDQERDSAGGVCRCLWAAVRVA